MAGPNPLPQLGPLNRIRATVLFPLFPQLNISAAFITPEGIRMAINGQSTQMIPAMVSQVQSQNVYLPAQVQFGIVKTTALATLWKRKLESNSNLGPCTVRVDSAALDVFDLVNCAVENFEGIDASGTNAAFPIMIAGTYYINSDLFNLA